jgi:predicted flavoprotein YhiN
LITESRHGRLPVEAVLADLLPQRLAHGFSGALSLSGRRWAELSKADRLRVRGALTQWEARPAGTLGWKKAEVMLGGLDTRALESRTMAVRGQPNLFFIGETVDVTGHLGGHNFQWAWASAFVCAQAILSAH